MTASNTIDTSYIIFFDALKQKVETTRYQAARKINQELILLYHHIGTQILKSQKEHGWGAIYQGSSAIIYTRGQDTRGQVPSYNMLQP